MKDPLEVQMYNLFYCGYHNNEIYIMLRFEYPEDWKRIADARKRYEQKYLAGKIDE